MEEPSKAVFLSYASQDAEAAQRIADALRTVGVEVWLDRSELRGGEAWDASIRRQIKRCHLFLAMISENTQAREEGYFRREWHLAIDRTLDMAHDRAFLLPVVIDATLETEARVPEKFHEVQWTWLSGGDATGVFIERVRGLISPDAPLAPPAPAHAVVPAMVASDTRGQFIVPQRSTGHRPLKWLMLAVPLLAVVAAAVIFIPPWQQREHARNVLLPGIQEITSKMNRSDGKLLKMAEEVDKSLPDDPALAKLWPNIAVRLSIETEPAGAEVFWRDYGAPTEEWTFAGITPLKDTKVPNNQLRMEIRKKGYQTIEIAGPRPETFSPDAAPTERYVLPHLTMDPLGNLPENMVRIPTTKNKLIAAGLSKYTDKVVPGFLVDKFEVTNRQFKAFVDAGGYTNTAYWRFPILEAGNEIPLAVALARFKDRTGRPGPAMWVAGTYPDGMADHPVTGVSWYEAEAYAAYAKKKLPTAFHWAQIADIRQSEFLVPFSNFSGKATTAVGSLNGLSSYGVYDIAGNAREWVFNPSQDPSQRYILGGGWNDAAYAFNGTANTLPALDRSESNGFRCIEELSDSSATAELRQPIIKDFRDYTKETPVDDKTFATFARQFAYDKTELDAKIEKVVTGEYWKVEQVSINAAYNHERMQVYVFLPLHVTKPLQAVITFPGSYAIEQSRFDPREEIGDQQDFILKSGRALIWPIYKGTFERQDGLRNSQQDESVAYKDHVIMWSKDLARTIDYLDSRQDLRADAIAYLGESWGGFLGGILPAVEKRVRVVVLNCGGMVMEKTLPEVDQINYVPRIHQPFLLLNGKYDMYFPLETAQRPLINLLGTAKDQKKLIVYAEGHRVPPIDLAKETLAWLDTYLGPAQ